MEHLRLILIGPPGVGKGTQSALLRDRLGLIPLSSGDIFRREIEAKTDLGRMAQRYIEHGQLVPNGVTIEMMAKRIADADVRKHGFVLDGFPRTVRQAEALQEILEELEMGLTSVISLTSPDDLIVSRLSGRLGCTKCGEIYHSTNKPPKREGLCDKCNGPLFVRSDDEPGTILARLVVFREQTSPVLDYYERLGLLRVVDASTNAEAAYSQIIA